jgi:hypothetical protein
MFLVRYQQFASHAYYGTTGPVSKMASQQKKAVCVLRFEVSRSVITVQREFCARFRTAGSAYATSSSKLCTKLMLHWNHGSGHLKTEHTESLFLLWHHLGNWPRGPAVSMRSELLVEHEKLGQLPLHTVLVVPVQVRNKFLVNFWNFTILLCMPCIWGLVWFIMVVGIHKKTADTKQNHA